MKSSVAFIAFLLLVVLTSCLDAHAQDSHSPGVSMPKDFTVFSWEMSIPTGNKYLSENSLSGWRLEYRRMVKKNLSIGIAASWNSFDQTFPTNTYYSPNKSTAVTTDMIRQVYTVPITLTSHYYFNTKILVFQPYVGVGLGTQYEENNTYFNIYQITENNWGFVARPEIGTLIHFGKESPVKGMVSVGYNWSDNKIESANITNWSHLAVNIGVGIGAF
jgi:outer membrane protein W